MRILDNSIRTIDILMSHYEIINALIKIISSETDIQITQFDKFNFEFVKEGSPEYTTDKIKCRITKQIDLKNEAV